MDTRLKLRTLVDGLANRPVTKNIHEPIINVILKKILFKIFKERFCLQMKKCFFGNFLSVY